MTNGGTEVAPSGAARGAAPPARRPCGVTRGCSTSQRRCSWSGVLTAHRSTPLLRQLGSASRRSMRVTATSAICSRRSCSAGFEIGLRLYRRQPRPGHRQQSQKYRDDLTRAEPAHACASAHAGVRHAAANSGGAGHSFPELARLAHEDGWLCGIRGVAILFRQFAARGEINVDDPELAADLFLNLLLGHTTRLALHGIAIDPEFLERRRRAAVEFCSGCRARS